MPNQLEDLLDRVKKAPRTVLANVDGDRLIGPPVAAITIQDQDAIIALLTAKIQEQSL